MAERLPLSSNAPSLLPLSPEAVRLARAYEQTGVPSVPVAIVAAGLSLTEGLSADLELREHGMGRAA